MARCIKCGTPLYLDLSIRLGYCDDHRPRVEPAPLMSPFVRRALARELPAKITSR